MTTEYGQQTVQTNAGDYNALVFVIRQQLQKLQTVTLVRVVRVSNAGGLSPVGTVDVQPLVNQMTGNRQSIPHGIIARVPYLRIQGGGDAVILDPKVGDIGMCGFASRDISAVKAAKGPANPGSFRQYDWADALYFGGFLNGTPTQYVQFNTSGIKVVSPTAVDIQAPTITLDGDVHITGTTTADGDVTAEGTSLHTHVHSGVQPGGGNSGPPV
jgi:hypothetical protein